MLAIRVIAKLTVNAARNWSKDDVPRMGASLAYTTLFSLAPMLVIVTAIGSAVFGADAVQGRIADELGRHVGREGAEAVQTLLRGAQIRGHGTLAVVLGSALFLLGATGAFLELQHALNTVFRVKTAPKAGFVRALIASRLRSFGILLAIGFLLLVSLMLSAALTAASAWTETHAWGGAALWVVLNTLVSLALIVALFALIYRFLPDVHLSWPDIWIGATITAVLFAAGKELIATYLGHSAWTSSYGVVGSVVILLLWIYYSAQLVLFGAELTRQCAQRRGRTPEPKKTIARHDPGAHPSAEQTRPAHPRRKRPAGATR